MFARWERDNTPIAAFPGKYEWAGERTKGDCSLRILNANFDYDNGGWVCQVTASSFKERDTLISHPANLVVRGESKTLIFQYVCKSFNFNVVAC